MGNGGSVFRRYDHGTGGLGKTVCDGTRTGGDGAGDRRSGADRQATGPGGMGTVVDSPAVYGTDEQSGGTLRCAMQTRTTPCGIGPRLQAG